MKILLKIMYHYFIIFVSNAFEKKYFLEKFLIVIIFIKLKLQNQN